MHFEPRLYNSMWGARKFAQRLDFVDITFKVLNSDGCRKWGVLWMLFTNSPVELKILDTPFSVIEGERIRIQGRVAAKGLNYLTILAESGVNISRAWNGL